MNSFCNSHVVALYTLLMEKRRLFALLLYVLVLGVSIPFVAASAQNMQSGDAVTANPYTVEDVIVDVTAASAVKARDEAIRKAQTKSVPKLITQLKNAGYNTVGLETASSSTLANALSDFEVSDEQIASTRYKASFTLHYSKSALQPFLSGGAANTYGAADSPYGTGGVTLPYGGIDPQNPNPVAEATARAVSPEKILVLPFLQIGNNPLRLWTKPNPWLEAWAANPPEKILVPIGDLKDINDLADNQALTYTPERLAKMTARYGAGRVAVLLTSYEGRGLTSDLSVPASGRVNVAVYDATGERPNYIDQVSVEAKDNETAEEFFKRAINEATPLIRKVTPAPQVAPVGAAAGAYQQPVPQAAYAGRPQAIKARVEYGGMGEWIAIQQKLRATPGILSVQVLSLRPQAADILISHAGTVDALGSTLSGEGFGLRSNPDPNGLYTLYSTQGAGVIR
ncbi:MAG: hypothetical protein AB7E85_03475 [Pseudobdellovibrionaceae bacterium]